MGTFLELQPGLPLYAHPDLLRERFSRRAKDLKSVGLRLAEPDLHRLAGLRLSAAPQEILPGIWTTGEIAERPEPEGRSPHHFVRDANGWAPDPYRDDMALVLDSPSGLVLVCGCCHAGLLYTLVPGESETLRACVIEVPEEGTIDQGEFEQPYQCHRRLEIVVRFYGLVEKFHTVDDRAVQVGLDRVVQAGDVGQDRPDAGAQQALASTPAHAPRQQHLAALDGLHHAQMRRCSRRAGAVAVDLPGQSLVGLVFIHGQ